MGDDRKCVIMKKEKQRKSKYDKIAEKLDVIASWKRNGLTDEEVWTRLGIAKNTFYKYKNEHQEFCDALNNAREEADLIVENTAFKMANGFFVPVKQLVKEHRVYYDDHGRKCETDEYVEKDVLQYVPPNPTMTIFWLRNRKSGDWNKQIGHIDGGQSDGGGIIEIPMADTEIISESDEREE